jgi:hypothetical protein
MTAYKHTQIGHAIIYPFIAISCILLVVAAVSPLLRLGIVLALPLLLLVWIFSKLTITIDETRLHASFGPGFVYKDVPLDRVVSCEPVRIKWWEGWGIHLSRFGWLYNVSGWDAVAIQLRDGRRLAIGTDQPNELAAAIRRSASTM